MFEGKYLQFDWCSLELDSNQVTEASLGRASRMLQKCQEDHSSNIFTELYIYELPQTPLILLIIYYIMYLILCKPFIVKFSLNSEIPRPMLTELCRKTSPSSSMNQVKFHKSNSTRRMFQCENITPHIRILLSLAIIRRKPQGFHTLPDGHQLFQE